MEKYDTFKDVEDFMNPDEFAEASYDNGREDGYKTGIQDENNRIRRELLALMDGVEKDFLLTPTTMNLILGKPNNPTL